MNKHLDFLTNLCSTHLVVFSFISSGVGKTRRKAESKNGCFKRPATAFEGTIRCSSEFRVESKDFRGCSFTSLC